MFKHFRFSKHLPKLLFCILLFSKPALNQVNAQEYSGSEIKAALIFNIIKSIEFNDIRNEKTINFGLYGEDSELISEIMKMSGKSIKNKKIRIIRCIDLENFNLTNLDLLFIFKEREFQVSNLSKKIINNSVFLMTDNYAEKRNIMLNFVYGDNNTIKFELNSSNIKQAGYTISPKLLLLGGSEVDVRDLYLETEKVLKDFREKMALIIQELKQKKTEVTFLVRQKDSLNEKIGNYSEIIKVQVENIENQKYNIDSINNLLIELPIQASKSERHLDSINNLLSVRNFEVSKLDKELLLLQYRLKDIKTQYADLKMLNYDSEKLVRSQRLLMYFFVAFIFLLTIFVFVVYRNYRSNKIQNAILGKRNMQINKQKEQIEKQANQLLITNRELEIQKEKVEQTLKKLKGAKTRLVESGRLASIGQLTAGIAHEINNPVNYISSSIEGLRFLIDDVKTLMVAYDDVYIDQKPSRISEVKKQLDYEELLQGFDELTSNIKLGVNKTKEIVKSLSSFSRVDEDNFTKVDLNKIIRDTLVLLGNQFKHKIKLILKLGEIPKIEASPGKISQVFLNMLINAIQAIHASSREGEINLKTEVVEIDGKNYCTVIIRDNGVGMHADIKDKIFDPFFTTKEVGEGTGLGLSISYNIVRKHKGHIEVKTRYKSGTSFITFLPITQT